MKKFAYVLVAVLCLFYLASGTHAQTVQGVITGAVTDPSGAVVPNASVTLINVGTGASQTTTSSSDGSYRFALVPPGTYTVDVKSTNFSEFRASGVIVQASQVVPLNVKLELGKTTQVVEVVEQTPLVQTATSELGLQIDRAQIENAPLVDRDVFGVLPFLAPQVSPGIDGMPSAGGSRESGTSYLMNGGEDNDNFSEGSINIRPPLDSIQDFSVLTNSMSAQYGRGTGAIVSANQKSGTNKFHGSAYEFNRNALLNANSFFYDKQLNNDTQHLLSKRPKYIRNQFGGEIDGPIIKDKTFFSFAYDQIKLLASTTNANTFVPTSAGLSYALANANGNGSGTPSIAQQILKAYPPVTSDTACPGIANTGAGSGYWGNSIVPNPVGCLSFTDPENDAEHTYYGRVDHSFSTRDRLSFAANIYRQDFVDKFGGGPLTTAGPINGTTTNHFHNLSLSESHVFSPRLVNEVTVTHNRHYNIFIEGNGTDAVPNILIDGANGGCLGYYLGGPFEGGQVEGFVQDRWSMTDNLTYTLGRHSLKVGFGTQYGILYRNWDLGNPGQYEFAELSEINGSGSIITPTNDGTLQPDGTIAHVVHGKYFNTNLTGDYPYYSENSIDPSTGSKGNAYRHYTYHDWNWFVQDDWKLSTKLTLNLGLRWDRYGAPSESHGIIAQATNVGSCDILQPACIASIRVGPVSRMWPTQNHDFAPRVGFAWDPGGQGKMAIRGGYGIYYDRIFDNIWSNGAWNPPFYALADLLATSGDAIFFSNPASIGTGYTQAIATNPGCIIPNNAVPGVCGHHRVSVRLMDQNMKDASSNNYYLSVERQFAGSFLARLGYQGSMGRHLPMLENYNRYDGAGYNSSLAVVRPNTLYSGFNYRSDSVSSNYNSLVAELQKRFSSGLQFETGYTYSKLLDVNSELFAGCSFQALTANNLPYYYITNSNPRLNYGPAGFDHRHAYKFSVTYELPFLKAQRGFVGHALGGWQVGSFFQYYYGHPIDVHNSRSAIPAADASGNPVLDQNGNPFNVGGDYNLDGVLNDHPNFVGSSIGGAYSGGNPADGIFKDNNRIGCGGAGIPAAVNLAMSDSSCVGFTPNSLFINPAYPSGATPFERFGALGRDVFHGPAFVQLDLGLNKTFKLTERLNLQFRAQAQNLLNHPSFDCVDAGLGSSTFGQALCLSQQSNNLAAGSLGAPVSRIMSIGLRLAF